MNWRITNRNASNNYVIAEEIGHEEITYKGFMDLSRFQPDGLGAMYQNGVLVKCGFWKNGELPPDGVLAYDEYNQQMNDYFNKG